MTTNLKVEAIREKIKHRECDIKTQYNSIISAELRIAQHTKEVNILKDLLKSTKGK
ncbi:unnamed protein product [marine sediment metagenome]|uniref:Uncharacterized protein n=1 Tax=marine sediment metagenome TaxID=412755 RepID=X0YJK9_9ZZZZ